jgi:hypothetical protein
MEAFAVSTKKAGYDAIHVTNRDALSTRPT